MASFEHFLLLCLNVEKRNDNLGGGGDYAVLTEWEGTGRQDLMQSPAARDDKIAASLNGRNAALKETRSREIQYTVVRVPLY